MRNSDAVAAAVEAAVGREGERFSLDPSRLGVTYVVNRGGFVNASFHVTDGARRLHVKVAREEETCAKLRRWAALSEPLASHYAAPRVRGTLETLPHDLFALVFDHVAGAPPSARDGAWLHLVVSALERLHADDALAARLPASASTCRERYLANFDRRFRSDLAYVRSAAPAWLAPPLLDQMEEAASRLADLVRVTPAFDAPADAPTHADLWSENVLITPDADVVILDWDELARGDPVMDWAPVFGYAVHGGALTRGPEWMRERLTHEECIRFDIYRRATLLDWVIDPLADWVDADDAPQDAGRMRAEKEHNHRAARAEYERLYGMARAHAPGSS